MKPDFERQLEKYAEVIIKVGLNVQPGQAVVINAPVEAALFVRLAAASAYRAGARYVDVLYSDEQVRLARFRFAPRDSFEEYPAYRAKGMEEYGKQGSAMLAVYAENPDLLKDQDHTLVALAERTASKYMKPANEYLYHNELNWSVVSYPIPSWAARVFPDLPPEDALQSLWEAIFTICRMDRPDPVSAWRDHIHQLDARAKHLNDRHFSALHLTGPGTDLTVGLPPEHIWESGETINRRGIRFVANIPTEEVWTLPHREQVEGTVTATRPLNHNGSLIEGFSLTFEKGRVVSYRAAQGEGTLKGILETDEGASRLGEVSLVTNSSPISQSGIMFYNTLFDENAACHVALGHAYPTNLRGGELLSEEDFASAGGNNSLAHVDFMIGSGEIDVDGVREDGSVEPVMRAGEWAVAL